MANQKVSKRGKRLGFRVPAETVLLMDRIAEAMSRKMQIVPSRTQVFELAIKMLGRSKGVL